MAYEIPVFDLGTLVAGADLSGDQYRWVKMGTAGTAGKVVLCSAAGEIPLGILQNCPRLGESASVRILGVSKVVMAIAEVLVAGDMVGTAATANAMKATTGQNTAGMMLEAGTGSTPAKAVGTVLLTTVGKV